MNADRAALALARLAVRWPQLVEHESDATCIYTRLRSLDDDVARDAVEELIARESCPDVDAVQRSCRQASLGPRPAGVDHHVARARAALSAGKTNR